MKIKLCAAPLLATLVLGLSAASPAFGQASLTGPSTVISPQVGGTNCKTTPGTPCPDSYQFAPGPGTANTNVTEFPTTYAFTDTFNQPGSTSTFSDFGSSVYTSGVKCPASPNCLNSNPFLTWNFQDNFDFTTPSSGPQVQGAVLSFSIPNFNVGLNNVEARIVSFVNGATPAQLVGNSGVTIVDGWTTVKSGSGLNMYTATLNSTTLAANTEYVLQIRGEALNSAGSYTGSVTFTPVPLPPAVVLLLSGLVGFVLFRYRLPALRAPGGLRAAHDWN